MTEPLSARLGRTFRRQREALGYSQEAFADEIGMHRTYYSAIERGEKNLQLNTIEKLVDGLGGKLWEYFKEAEGGK